MYVFMYLCICMYVHVSIMYVYVHILPMPANKNVTTGNTNPRGIASMYSCTIDDTSIVLNTASRFPKN